MYRQQQQHQEQQEAIELGLMQTNPMNNHTPPGAVTKLRPSNGVQSALTELAAQLNTARETEASLRDKLHAAQVRM